jgi:NAD(P)H dehydrogenase (quinone)
MTIYGVTGATGGFGAAVITSLINKGVPADNIVAIARNLGKAETWASKGLNVRLGNFDEPATLQGALEGVDVLLLISTVHSPRRVTQHKAVIDAAVKAGTNRIVYTSILKADTSEIVLARDHLATEKLLAAAPLYWTLLRNSWYLELYVGDLARTIESGVTIGSATGGRVSAAARDEYAEAAAAVMVEAGHEDKIYELGGDSSFSYDEFAHVLSRLSGKTVRYVELTPAAHRNALLLAGVPEDMADIIVDSDQGIPRGSLETTSHSLSQLIGRPTKTVDDFLAEHLRNGSNSPTLPSGI